jgi:hypothetical protein
MQGDQLLPMRAGALEWDEPGHLVVDADQPVAVAGQHDRAAQVSHPQRDDQPARGGKLLDPRRRDIPRAGRDEDPIERGVTGGSLFGVAEDDVHRVVSGAGEETARTVSDKGVDVDGRNLPFGAGQLRHQGRVVAA